MSLIKIVRRLSLCSNKGIVLSTATSNSTMGKRFFGKKRRKKDKVQVPLKAVLKKFYLKTHPDLFMNHPDEKEVNEQSLQHLQGLLDELKDSTEYYPPASHISLDFYLRVSGEEDFKHATLDIRTSGGECKQLVKKNLSHFFDSVGLPSEFEWGSDFWQTPLLTDVLREEQMQAAAERKET
mmetsp:Transcript_31632/g.44050  ORF Transcript_31632/g.44050 Transcript_31632/m.44050 type:complete len:181 (+) Transcript_31632:66-608(+)